MPTLLHHSGFNVVNSGVILHQLLLPRFNVNTLKTIFNTPFKRVSVFFVKLIKLCFKFERKLRS